jgi:GT2 family glycosyltransferase
MNIAVLLTCHNRKIKTLICLNALFTCKLSQNYQFEVYLVDDGSTDGTGEAVKTHFPRVNVIQGNGNLFWAGGMRLAWAEALTQNYDGYLLLNDDTTLFSNSLIQLFNAHNYSVNKYSMGGIYIGTTNDPITNEYTYGGRRILSNLTGKSQVVKPQNGNIQSCDFANGNILFVSKNVVDAIGILSNKFTHFLADYDYTLTAKKRGFPILVCDNYCGACENDHGNNWLSSDFSLSERINYLKSPKHLAYNEYLFFIKRHFPFYLPISFLKLWAKTLFPTIWDKFKK